MKQYRFAHFVFIGLFACISRLASAADSGLVHALGTIEPRDVVDVGSDVRGVIKTIGTDSNGTNEPISYNSRVKKGDVLAMLDQREYQQAVLRAKARLQTSRFEIELAKAQVLLAQRELDRVQKKAAANTADGTDLDVAKAAVDVAVGKVRVQEGVYEERKTALDAAQLSLDSCTIRSPVDGIVISKRAYIGQTSEGTLNQPSLFLIADPKFQVWCSISEADIGRVKPGQNCRFTAEAFPDKEFSGRISKIRLNAQSAQNVVVYTAEIEIDNQEPLLPYLTAKVEILLTAAGK